MAERVAAAVREERGERETERGEMEQDADATLLPSLPDDVLAKLFKQVGMNPKTLAVLSCVCKAWRTAIPASGAWHMLCDEAGRAPRRPRKPWRELYLDNLR